MCNQRVLVFIALTYNNSNDVINRIDAVNRGFNAHLQLVA